MAKEILLRFGTRNLDKAAKIAKRLKKRLREATAEGSAFRGIAEGLIRGNEQALVQAAGQKRQQGRANAIRRASFATGSNDAGLSDRADAFSRVGGRVLAGVSAAKAISQGNLLAGASFAASFLGGPAGVAVQAATIAMEFLRPAFEKREKELRGILERDINAKFDEALNLLDVARRLKEDPAFAAEQSRRFGDELIAARAAAEALDSPFNRSMNQRMLRPRGGLGDL